MPKEVTRFACQKCDQEYRSRAEAEVCEVKEVEEPICRVGDKVKVTIPGRRGYSIDVEISRIEVEPRTHYQRYHWGLGGPGMKPTFSYGGDIRVKTKRKAHA